MGITPTFLLDIGRIMKVIILCLFLGTTLGAPGGPTPHLAESLNEKFLDPKEEAAAAEEEFAEHEAELEENNADYEAGNSNFMEEVEPWDEADWNEEVNRIETSCYLAFRAEAEYTEKPLKSHHEYSKEIKYWESFSRKINRFSVSGGYKASVEIAGIGGASKEVSFAVEKFSDYTKHNKNYHYKEKMETTHYQEGTKQIVRKLTESVIVNGSPATEVDREIIGSRPTSEPTDFDENRKRAADYMKHRFGDGKGKLNGAKYSECLIPCSAGCNFCHTCSRNDDREKQLALAAKNGQIDRVKTLLKDTYVDSLPGVKVQMFGPNFWTYTKLSPLTFAAMEGHRNIAKLLFIHGANPKLAGSVPALFINIDACIYNDRIGNFLPC